MPTEAVLDERIEKSLRDVYEELKKQGELLTEEQLKAYYAVFRSRFGPERLRSLDGEALLEAMHTHGNYESLVYWLEFKDDDEFPANFGSIAGGSAHKFGLFRRKETGQWVSGASTAEVNLTVGQAVEVARKHRDELLAGIAVLEKFPKQTSDDNYLKLQAEMDKAAPTVARLAWGHKYFSLLFPEILDDYHNHAYQRFHLIKLLLLPPPQEGLYVSAGRFVRLAAHFGWPMNHLTTVTNERDGRPIKYWRVGTKPGGTDMWSAMRDGGYVAIGWSELGDLSKYPTGGELKDAIQEKLQPLHYGDDAKTASRKAGEIRNFAANIQEGDIVVAADGQTILGVGRITGDYRFDDSEPSGAPHRRPVEWISTEEWKLPEFEGKLTTVYPLKHEENFIEIEKHLLEPQKKIATAKHLASAKPKTIVLEGIGGRIQSILERKLQVILYGPPGTGKTFWARDTARQLAAMSTFGKLFGDLTSEEQSEVDGDANEAGLLRFCTFHPAYGYEDFIEGYRPQHSQTNQLIFERRDGIFKQLCDDARDAKDRRFFLLIDEINRGDVPRIFGELLTLLERDKRGMQITLPVSGKRFWVPPNVFVIGTMNTADRSIALLDTALRRRFGFVELMPDTRVLAGVSVGGRVPLAAWLDALNDRIRANCGHDARNRQIGHAYFLEDGHPVESFPKFARIVAEEIIPLLEDYCYEDYSTLKKILGDGLVDDQHQRIREELFAPAHQEKLIQSLVAVSPEMSTSLEAAHGSEAVAESEEGADAEGA